MRNFNEDTRVKIPATLQFLRLGYQYQSMNDSDIDFNTKIFINRFKPALEKINGRSFSNGEVRNVLDEIHTLIRSNDLGREFYKRLNDVVSDVKLIDFDNVLKDYLDYYQGILNNLTEEEITFLLSRNINTVIPAWIFIWRSRMRNI